MKTYLSPETKSLQVQAQNIVCGSKPSPAPSAPGRMNLPEVTKTNGSW